MITRISDIPGAKKPNIYDAGSEYKGISASFVARVLRGESVEKFAVPLDADDFSRCVVAIENYLTTCDLNAAPVEKWLKPLENVSASWSGIVEHYVELRNAMLNNVPSKLITAALQHAKNEGILDEMRLRMRKVDFVECFKDGKKKIAETQEKMEVCVSEVLIKEAKAAEAEAKAKARAEAEALKEEAALIAEAEEQVLQARAEAKSNYFVSPESKEAADKVRQSTAKLKKSMMTKFVTRDCDFANACISLAAKNGFSVISEHKENFRVEDNRIMYNLVLRILLSHFDTPQLIDQAEFPKHSFGVTIRIAPELETEKEYRETKAVSVAEHNERIHYTPTLLIMAQKILLELIQNARGPVNLVLDYTGWRFFSSNTKSTDLAPQELQQEPQHNLSGFNITNIKSG